MRVVSLACIFLFVALVATAQQPAPAATTASPQLTTRTATTADIATPAAASKDVIIIPAGTKVPITLKMALSSKNARAGDSVYAATNFPLAIDNRILVPAGTYVQGVITEVKRGGHIKGRAEVLLHFRTLIYPNGYTVALPGAVDSAPGIESTRMKDSEGTIQSEGQTGKKVGTVASTAGTGAVIGGLSTASAKGALIGGGIGAAVGTAIGMLGRGQDVRLETGTVLDMVFQRPVTLERSKLDAAAR